MKGKKLLFICSTAVLLSVPGAAFPNPLPIKPPPAWTAKVLMSGSIMSGSKKQFIVAINASGNIELSEKPFPVASSREVLVERRQLNKKDLDRVYSLIFIAIDEFRLRPPNGSVLDAFYMTIKVEIGQRSMEVLYNDITEESDLPPGALRLRKFLERCFPK